MISAQILFRMSRLQWCSLGMRDSFVFTLPKLNIQLLAIWRANLPDSGEIGV